MNAIFYLTIVALAAAATVFLVLIYYSFLKPHHRIERAAPHRHAPLACPRCGRWMKTGYVMAGRGLHWRDASEERLSAFATLASTMENTLSLSWRTAENIAWRCPECQLVVLDHRSLVIGKVNETPP